MRNTRKWSVIVPLASGLVLAGCGGSVNVSTGGTATTSSSAQATTVPASPTTTSLFGPALPTTTAAASTIATIPAKDRSPAGVAGKAPTVVVPPGPPPTQLESADLIVGNGATAQSGDSLTVQYVLATYSTRKVVQSSWTGQPFTFSVGEGQVIPGWDQGVLGMRVGGRRELIIPPSLGYGATSPGSGIGKNDTLVFVVDLLKVG